VGAGTMTQRLRNSPIALRNQEINGETKNAANKGNFLRFFLRIIGFLQPNF
jgi:hypothetical protein